MTPSRPAVLRSFAVSVLAGVAVGVVVGGLGSRVAMRLTAAWTDGPPFTLNGAEVGEVTGGGTLSLLFSAAQAGVIAGVLYALLRPALPSRLRTAVFAGLALVLGGGIFLGDDEFTLFEPSLLAAALFLPLFPAGGFALAAFVERLDPRQPRPWTRGRQLVVAAVAVAGAATLLRNALELA